MKTKRQKIASFCILVLMLVSTLANAQFQIPKKPNVQTSVYDYSQLLNPQQAAQLEQKLIRY